MAAAAPIRHTVNGLIMADPTAALAVAGGLVAVGAGLTLREVFKELRLDKVEMSDEARYEVDMLQEADPHGFAYRAVRIVHSALTAAAFRGWSRNTARVNWKHDNWTAEYMGTTLSGDLFDPEGKTIERVDVGTPVYDPISGKLV
jgi:hypothetical protein